MLLQNRTRVVIDVNIFISGLIAKKKGMKTSPPFMVLKQLESREFTLMTNGKIIEEYDRKLYEKIKEGLIESADAEHFLKIIKAEGIVDRMFVTPQIYVHSDPSDNAYFLSENCLSANYLVTGNTTDFAPIKADLVELNRKLKIISASEFLKRNRNVPATITEPNERDEKLDAIEKEIEAIIDQVNNLEHDNEAKRILGSGMVNAAQFKAMTEKRSVPLVAQKDKLMLQRQFILDRK